MGQAIHVLESAQGKMGTDLGSRHILMTEQFLDHPDFGSIIQHVACKAMAESMGTYHLICTLLDLPPPNHVLYCPYGKCRAASIGKEVEVFYAVLIQESLPQA